MTSSDRIKKILKGEIPDRIPICDTSFWPKTIERWIKEGLPENIDIYDYFGIDRITFLSFKTGIFERELISETEDKVIFKDEFGKVNIDWKTESGNFGVPHVIDNFFKGKEDWYRIKNEIKPEEKRIPANISEIYNLARSKGDFIALTIEEPCWFIINRTYGFEKGLLLLIEEKEMVFDIMETITNLNIEMCKMIFNKGIKPDSLWFWSDLCYKNGMLFSPKIFKEMVMPFHKIIKNFCKENDLFLIFHCDGYVKDFIPLLIEEGVDAIQPLEVRAGNDVREYKKIWKNEITFFGNISADVLSGNIEEIRIEIESKLKIAKENGKYIYHIDHSVPPTVSLKNYTYAINLAKQIGSY